MSIILNILLLLFIVVRDRKAINKTIKVGKYYMNRFYNDIKRDLFIKAVGMNIKTLNALSIKVDFEEKDLTVRQIKYLNSKGYKYLTDEEKKDLAERTLPEEESYTDVFTVRLFIGTTAKGYYEIVTTDIKGNTQLKLNMKMFGSHDRVLRDKRVICILDAIGERVYFNEDIYNKYADFLAPYYSTNRKRKKMGIAPFIDSQSFMLTCVLTKEQLMSLEKLIDAYENDNVESEVAATVENVVNESLYPVVIHEFKELKRFNRVVKSFNSCIAEPTVIELKNEHMTVGECKFALSQSGRFDYLLEFLNNYDDDYVIKEEPKVDINKVEEIVADVDIELAVHGARVNYFGDIVLDNPTGVIDIEELDGIKQFYVSSKKKKKLNKHKKRNTVSAIAKNIYTATGYKPFNNIDSLIGGCYNGEIN